MKEEEEGEGEGRKMGEGKGEWRRKGKCVPLDAYSKPKSLFFSTSFIY